MKADGLKSKEGQRTAQVHASVHQVSEDFREASVSPSNDALRERLEKPRRKYEHYGSRGLNSFNFVFLWSRDPRKQKIAERQVYALQGCPNLKSQPGMTCS